MRERAHAKSKATFWKPEKDGNVGESIEGPVIAIHENMGDFGSTHWHVQLDSGEIKIVSASPDSVLGCKLAGEHIAIHDRIYVEFLGDKKSKKTGKPYHDWATDCEHVVKPERAVKPDNGKAAPMDDDIPF
jgi:hypothetical protein